MRILTLWQPYASLMVLGLKTNETRHWDTDYRGPIGIHAAAGEPSWVKREVLSNEVFQRVFAEHGLNFKQLPRGKILGTVTIESMLPTHVWVARNADDFLKPTPDEWYFGDYSPRRWAWITSNPTQLVEPIPAKGKQGWWNFDLSGYEQKAGSQLTLFH